MKRLILIFLFISVAVPSFARIKELPFEEIIKQSDIIIEGEVLTLEDVSVKYGEFTYFKKASFKLTKTHKGKFKSGEIINIYANMDFACDVSDLKKDQAYLLFLKKFNDGYVDTHYGRGKYLIGTKGHKKIILRWSGESSDQAQDYNKFIKNVKLLLDSNLHN